MQTKNAIILFDGVCNFCNSSVNFVIDHDKADYFRFAALQSDAGKQVLNNVGRQMLSLDTFILIQDGVVYERSTAALKVARRLDWPINWLYAFIIVPKFIRDTVYKIIAQNRYKWFGMKDVCRIPTPAEKNRFI